MKMRAAARQKRTSTKTAAMTATRVVETVNVFVAAVESAELAEVEGEAVAAADTLTCTASGAVGDAEPLAEDDVVVAEDESDSSLAAGDVVGLSVDVSESDVEGSGVEGSGVEAGAGVEVDWEGSDVDVESVPLLVSLSTTVRLKDWNAI